MTWVLILTLVVASNYRGYPAATVAVHSVPGFRTEAACTSAAAAWLKQAETKNVTYIDKNPRALCVQQP